MAQAVLSSLSSGSIALYSLTRALRNKTKTAMRYFEDLNDGEHLHCLPVQLTRESIMDFAGKYDPQPFHVDDKLEYGYRNTLLPADNLLNLQGKMKQYNHAVKMERDGPGRFQELINNQSCGIQAGKGRRVPERRQDPSRCKYMHCSRVHLFPCSL